ncbi:putative acyl-CoA dehydrogenase YdbM [Pullulanibacillus camelliae]|uniref:Putative acyl-CoA dehydrogenase YdbM n=1 Tax=Pullulanibacillus camelliae TaxID=1707096 RepID=A0A8J2VRW5_9BACL|nr:acyl-CoA dehydrogenase family protein [Pullulanibacillus camelliae]GGE39400.1 putative acyl-CoA dehydrogenase YdbM [Pullulanibacillus camelliae]
MVEHLFLRHEHERKLYEKAKALAEQFSKDAAENDRTSQFPFGHFEKLKEEGVTSYTVPREFGGEEISVTELVILQEQLGQGDPATALSLGWHLGVVMDLADRRSWAPERFQEFCEGLVKQKQLMNRVMTEPKTGSPTRGGKPQTTAKKLEKGWVLNGKKTFSTLSAFADWFLVTASIEGREEVGWFLVHRKEEGVSVNKTWDTLGMRATRSDDVLFNQVHIGEEALVEIITKEKTEQALPPAWLLHIPACYLGIALAARRDVIQFAETYKPNSLDFAIKDVPRVRDRVGEIEHHLLQARHVLYNVARQWDECPEQRQALGPSLAVAKTVALEAASQVVDIAMRIVGGTSLNRSLPFERYYRDVRAGLFNPPTEDSVLAMLAKQAFNE